MNNQAFYQPRNLDAALAIFGDASVNARPIAGCTDYMVQYGGELNANEAFVDLMTIPELQGIHLNGDVLSIGAATTFTDIKNNPLIGEFLPNLVAVSGTIGAWQIQNRATIGGNIANASPAGDSLPVLLSLGASITLASLEGERSIPYQDMHLSYRKTALKAGELIKSIQIPLPPTGTQMILKKVGTREAQAISKILVSFYGEIKDKKFGTVRIGAGSLGPVPLRLEKTEALLSGKVINPALAKAAASSARQEVTPINDVRSTASYRQLVLGQVIQRMVLNCCRSTG